MTGFLFEAWKLVEHMGELGSSSPFCNKEFCVESPLGVSGEGHSGCSRAFAIVDQILMKFLYINIKTDAGAIEFFCSG